MVATGDGPVGASKLTGEVNNNIYRTLSIRKDFLPVFQTFETESVFLQGSGNHGKSSRHCEAADWG